MIANRKKLEIALARACMTSGRLPEATGLPRPTINSVIMGKSVRPATLGKVARALGVDVTELLEDVQ